MSIVHEGKHFDAVDVGNEGGRYAVARKNGETILQTVAGEHDERDIAIDTAIALDIAQQVKEGEIGKFKLWVEAQMEKAVAFIGQMKTWATGLVVRLFNR